MPIQARAKYSGRPRFRSAMEGDYYALLFADSHEGDVRAFAYEPVTFTVGVDERGRARRYTPDFLVIRKDGSLEFHEVKGSKNARGQQTAIQRLYAAAKLYPWWKWFYVDQGTDGAWRLQELRA